MATAGTWLHAGSARTGNSNDADDTGYGSFRKSGVPYFGVLYNKDPTIWGTILGSPVFGNPHIDPRPKIAKRTNPSEALKPQPCRIF